MSDLPRLPLDLIDGEIFSRFPVKCLLRFRCVSKHHCALIDSPDFIKTQLLKCSESNQNVIIWDTDDMYSANLNALDKPISLYHPLIESNKPNSSNTDDDDDDDDGAFVVLGSCDGLVCLFKHPRIVLWNPSTRKHHDLPVCEVDLPVKRYNQIQFVCYGFGYDRANDDYKLLRVTQYLNEVKNKVRIYSLKSDSWRTLKACPVRFATREGSPSVMGVFLKDSVHWLVSEKSGFGIAYIFAFHLGKEKYQFLPHPRFSDKNLFVNLGKLGGKLCLHCIYEKSHIDIWAMNTYGVKESWTKLLSVALYVDFSIFQFPTPVTYSKDGKQVLWQVTYGGKIFWYDLQLRIFKDACIPDIPSICMAFLSVESLVKLPHAANIGLLKHRRESKKREDFLLSEGFKRVL